MVTACTQYNYPHKPIERARLPETCSLYRLAPYAVVHIASGVAGLDAAVGTGLRIACLSISTLIEASTVAAPEGVLSSLPNAEFVLLRAEQSSANPANE